MHAVMKQSSPEATPEHADRVRAHFGARAAGYHEDSQRQLWGWLRRREAAAVEALLGGIAGHEVLELGCGAGFYTRLLLAGGAAKVVAVDITPEMLAALPAERVDPVLGDAATIQVGRRFSRLLSAGVLEFVPDPLAVLTNARRHAEEGATMVLLAPIATLVGRLYQAYHRGHGFPIHLFQPDALDSMVAAAGWRVLARRRVPPFTTVMALQAV